MKVEGVHTEVQVDDVVDRLTSASKVMIVPGYGVAVAKAQYAIADIVKMLTSNGVDVKFVIHPVAGRMRDNSTYFLLRLVYLTTSRKWRT